MADKCTLINDIVRDLEYAKSLEKKIKNKALFEDKMAAAQGLVLATFASSYSPIDFTKTNNEALTLAQTRASQKSRERYLKKFTGVSIVDPNPSGDPKVGSAIVNSERLSVLEKRRSTIESIIKCPVPVDKKQQVSAKDLNYLYDKEAVADELQQIYYEKLSNISGLFDKTYVDDLEILRNNTSEITYKTLNKTATRKVKTLDADGQPIYTNSPYSYQIQVFSTDVENKLGYFDDFQRKYSRSWLDKIEYAKDSMFSSAEIAANCDMVEELKNNGGKFLESFTKKTDSVSEKYKYIMSDCSQRMISDRDSYKKLFFENSLTQYRLWIIKLMHARAELMTAESEVMRGPLILDSVTSNSFNDNEDFCDKELSDAEMRRAALEVKYISMEYRALIADSKMKKSALMERDAQLKKMDEERTKKAQMDRLRDGSAWDVAIKDIKKGFSLIEKK